VNLYSAFY